MDYLYTKQMAELRMSNSNTGQQLEPARGPQQQQHPVLDWYLFQSFVSHLMMKHDSFHWSFTTKLNWIPSIPQNLAPLAEFRAIL